MSSEFPKNTGYFCPECGSPVVLDEVEEAHYDPGDSHGVGYSTSQGHYCTNEVCDFSVEPIEESDLKDTPNAKSDTE